MAEARLDPGSDRREVNARIVYWGAAGAGKATNLRAIHRKLRPDHRGKLEAVPTRLDPSVCSHRLPIELGEIAGVKTRIQIIAVPGGPEQAPTRKQLLDRVDGIVFVVDARRERIDDNVAALEELRGALAAYGRALESVPLVVQYNRQDQSDPFVLEELHRKLDVQGRRRLRGHRRRRHGRAADAHHDLEARREAAARGRPGGAGRTAGRAPSRVARAGPESAPVAPPAAVAPAAGAGRVRACADSGPCAAPSGRDTRGPRRPRAAPRSPPTCEAEDERDDAVARAQGLLDASWHEEVAVLDTPLGDTPLPSPDALFDDDGWQLVEAGLAEIVGTRAIAVPVVVADGLGHELRFRLTVSLELLVDE